MYSSLFKGNKSRQGMSAWNKGLIGVMPEPWDKGKKTGLRPWNKIGEGITPIDKLERARFRKQMQMTIFKRDSYTCQVCDEYGGKIQVDHIKSWSDYPQLRFEESNCRTLCMACHYYVTFKRKIPAGIVWGHNLSKRIV